MTTLGVVGGKLVVIHTNGYEIKPWGLEITDEQIVLSGLSAVKPSTYTGTLADFIKVDTGLPFGTVEELMEYVAPYLGFKTATGGSVAVYSSAENLRTGQTTSYIAGDDGDLQKGRDTDFFTLATPNVFGNQDRFTDLEGQQDYLADIMLDNASFNGTQITGYYRQPFANDLWDNQFPIIAAGTFGGFTNWRMINKMELMSITSDAANSLGYSALNFPLNSGIQTSTTVNQNTTQCFAGSNSGISNGGMGFLPKTSARTTIACRDFSLSELGL